MAGFLGRWVRDTYHRDIGSGLISGPCLVAAGFNGRNRCFASRRRVQRDLSVNVVMNHQKNPQGSFSVVRRGAGPEANRKSIRLGGRIESVLSFPPTRPLERANSNRIPAIVRKRFLSHSDSNRLRYSFDLHGPQTLRSLLSVTKVTVDVSEPKAAQRRTV